MLCVRQKLNPKSVLDDFAETVTSITFDFRRNVAFSKDIDEDRFLEQFLTGNCVVTSICAHNVSQRLVVIYNIRAFPGHRWL